MNSQTIIMTLILTLVLVSNVFAQPTAVPPPREPSAPSPHVVTFTESEMRRAPETSCIVERTFEAKTLPDIIGNEDDPAYKTYKEGYNFVLDEDWKDAQKIFEDLLSKYPKSEYVDDAKYWTAYSWKHLDRKKAIEAYKKFIKEYQNSSYYDDAVADLSELNQNVVVAHSNAVGSSTVTLGPGDRMVVDQNGMAGGKAEGHSRHFEMDLRAMGRKLGRTGRMQVVPIPALQPYDSDEERISPETQLKMDALYALGEMKEDDKSYQSLKDVAIDVKQPRPLREAALEALSNFKKHDVLTVYIEIAKHDTSEDMQDTAIEFISEAGNDKNKSVDALAELFASLPKHREPQMETILYSIADVGNEKAVEFLSVVAHTHQNYQLRSDAVYYLGNIGGDKARAALYDILKGK